MLVEANASIIKAAPEVPGRLFLASELTSGYEEISSFKLTESVYAVYCLQATKMSLVQIRNNVSKETK